MNRGVPLVVRHALSGALAASLLALADLVVASQSSMGTRVSPGEFLLAGAHTVVLYLSPGLIFGTALGALLVPLRDARWLTGVRVRVSHARGFLDRDPVAFGSGLAALAGLGAALLLGRAAHGYVSTSVHRDELAAWAIGGVAAGAVPLALLTFVVLAPLFSRAARLLGRLATVATFLGLVLSAAAGVFALYLSRNVEVRTAYGLPALLWGPLAFVLYVVAAVLVQRFSTDRRRAYGALAVVSAVACLGLLVSANTYGSRNRVRSVVEQRTVLGRRLVRSYASLTDRDGDRHTWAFGGGDCDDGDPSVHPGARDPEGDGIDADCFAGDGAPDVEPHGDGRFGARPTSLPAHPNVLVITIDALRRDHLHANGYPRDTSGYLDAFIDSAVEFTDVVPQSSRSLRSIPAMWTGLYASEIAFGPEYLWPTLEDENHTLAELLSARGYRTSAVMATDYFERVSGFFQGFSEVLQAETPDPARGWAVDQALPRMREMNASGAPWMLWVHLFNCHQPYLQDGTPSRFGPEIVDQYDTEIGLAGEQVQRLLEALEALGAAEETIVVLASDHGEGFGEHGTFNHSTTLYQEEMVPLLAFRVPGVASRHVDGVVGLLDMAPTIANLAGVRLDRDISGRSLVPYFDGSEVPDPERVVFSELLPDGIAPYDIKVARRGRHKLLWWVRDGTFQYFDLSTDPGERTDLSDDRRDEATELLGTVRAWLARAALPGNDTDALVAANVRSRPFTFGRRLGIQYEGLFEVMGIDLPDRVYHPGERIPLTFYYRVDGETDRDLFFVADLLGPPGVRLPAHFHAWHFPIHSHHHTDAWRAGTYIRDPTPIVIPEEVPAPVDIQLVLTVRDGDLGLEGVRDGERTFTFELATIRIEPRELPDAGVDAPIDAPVEESR